MIILSLDCSTSQTGWAVYDTEKRIFTDIGHFTYKNSHTVWLEFGRDLESLLVQHDPDHVVVEDIFLGPNPNTYRVLAKLQGIVAFLAAKHSDFLTVEYLMPSEWRKLCATKYNKKMNFRKTQDCKQASIELANTVLAGRKEVLSDDCADAVCLILAVFCSA